MAAKLFEVEPEIPIILTTGYSAKITEEEAIRIGIRKYLRKPVPNEILAKSLREVLDKCKT